MDLDRWLPDPQVRTRHRRTAQATADDLWQAAESVRVCESPTLGRIVRWRIPGTPRDLPFRELFSRYPFTVLEDGERYSVSGLCGRIWTLKRDYPRIDGPDEFLAWDKPNTAKVLFAHWVEEGQDGEAALVSESRIKPIGRRATAQTRVLWAAVGSFERFIGREALRVAAERS
ncbi:MAG: hypothetical protein QOG63_2654 [Thermoleophilaceae bacterium]|nr:hypothetical protein [Thermoleophilaceae bacterium]